jgi:hypothetical protein
MQYNICHKDYKQMKNIMRLLLISRTRYLASISMIFVLIISLIVLSISPLRLAYGSSFSVEPEKLAMTQTKDCCAPVLLVPLFASGSNVYMAWTNNDTGHWNVFFAKSIDGGKSFKTMIISSPNKGSTVNQNTEIYSSGTNVYVTWWTNKTGTLMPVFRASNDNGGTFGKIITLNSTLNVAPSR